MTEIIDPYAEPKDENSAFGDCVVVCIEPTFRRTHDRTPIPCQGASITTGTYAQGEAICTYHGDNNTVTYESRVWLFSSLDYGLRVRRLDVRTSIVSRSNGTWPSLGTGPYTRVLGSFQTSTTWC